MGRQGNLLFLWPKPILCPITLGRSLFFQPISRCKIQACKKHISITFCQHKTDKRQFRPTDMQKYAYMCMLNANSKNFLGISPQTQYWESLRRPSETHPIGTQVLCASPVCPTTVQMLVPPMLLTVYKNIITHYLPGNTRQHFNNHDNIRILDFSIQRGFVGLCTRHTRIAFSPFRFTSIQMLFTAVILRCRSNRSQVDNSQCQQKEQYAAQRHGNFNPERPDFSAAAIRICPCSTNVTTTHRIL